MVWNICFTIAIALLVAVLATVAFSLVSRYVKRKRIKIFKLLAVAIFLMGLVLYIPVYATEYSGQSYCITKTAVLSLHSTIRMFAVENDYTVIFDALTNAPEKIVLAYSALASVLYLLAPLMTFGFVLSFFKNLSAYIRYMAKFFRNVYVFSELNENSIALAKDILRNHRKDCVIFTDVDTKVAEQNEALLAQAEEIGALCFKKNISAINFKIHSSKKQIFFFALREKDDENIQDALELISKYKERRNTNLYVFSTSVYGELVIGGADRGVMKIRRINKIRALITNLLYEQGHELFDTALPQANGKKRIRAVVLGLGRHGEQMVRALAWYCQMDGYEVQIDAFEKDPAAVDAFCAACPGLMSEKNNGVYVDGEAQYRIELHSGVDVGSKEFADKISAITDATYVLVALGSDEENVKAAVNLRMLFERNGAKPVIKAILYNSDARRSLLNARFSTKYAYRIDFIGAAESCYTEQVIMNSRLENEALACHLRYGSAEEEFWKYEYNYRSSVASAVHIKARIECGIAGADQLTQQLSQKERDVIERLEHRRWNAYMRSEGFVYSGSEEPESRNDLAKKHHNLVDFDKLRDEDKRKDSNVGTKQSRKEDA